MSLFGNQNFIKDAIATAFGGNPLKLEGDMSFLWAILHLKGEPGGLGSQGTASGSLGDSKVGFTIGAGELRYPKRQLDTANQMPLFLVSPSSLLPFLAKTPLLLEVSV
jgi:hypothetical protein